MYPKHFFERFWESEQKNQLFVGMPFDESVNNNFDIINTSVKNLGFKEAFRVGIESEANSINDRIFDAIANSKMLLFDLSDDKRTGKINHNVIYELGIANAIREPSDIVLIRKNNKNEFNLPFDIQGLHINFFENELTREFIEEKIKNAAQNQQWHKSKRVLSAIESLDENGLSLMNQIGRNPKGYNHFNSDSLSLKQKESLLRLIDLGIIKFACAIWAEGGFEYAYHWTSFGYAVMKSLGIEQMTEEEFKKHPGYLQVMEAVKNFTETKDKFLNQAPKN